MAEVDLGALHETVVKLDRRLYGNGQPGDIRRLEDSIDKSFQEMRAFHDKDQHEMREYIDNINRSTTKKLEVLTKKYDRMLLYLAVIFVAVSFITGNGFGSLSTILQALVRLTH